MADYWESLYSEYRDKVYGYIYNKVGKQATAEDLTSAVFEKVLTNIEDFTWQDGKGLSSWIFTIARNTVYDHFRSARNRKNSGNSLDNMDRKDKEREPFDIQVMNETEEKKLYSVISHLDSSEQYLVYYKYFEGMTNIEISEKMDLSEANVATKLFRIRKKMKESFGE